VPDGLAGSVSCGPSAESISLCGPGNRPAPNPGAGTCVLQATQGHPSWSGKESAALALSRAGSLRSRTASPPSCLSYAAGVRDICPNPAAVCSPASPARRGEMSGRSAPRESSTREGSVLGEELREGKLCLVVDGAQGDVEPEARRAARPGNWTSAKELGLGPKQGR